MFAVEEITQSWGYSRAIEPIDIGPHTVWLRFGHDCYLWFYVTEDRLMTCHVASHPDARKRAHGGDARRLWQAITFLGDVAGARGIALKAPHLDHLLVRLGFEKDDGTLLDEPGWWVYPIDPIEEW